MKKRLFREVRVEHLNGKLVDIEYGRLKYETTNYKDEELLDIIRTDQYSKFIELIKQGKVRASGYYVSKNIFGKEVVKEETFWWDGCTIKEKNFKEFEIKKYIRFCDEYTLDNIRNDLSAEQFLDWCKDHKADTLKVEVVKK